MLHNTSRYIDESFSTVSNLPLLGILDDVRGDIFKYDNTSMSVSRIDDNAQVPVTLYYNDVSIPVEYRVTGPVGSKFYFTFNQTFDHKKYTNLLGVWNPEGLEGAKTTDKGVFKVDMLSLCTKVHDEQDAQSD